MILYLKCGVHEYRHSKILFLLLSEKVRPPTPGMVYHIACWKKPRKWLGRMQPLSRIGCGRGWHSGMAAEDHQGAAAGPAPLGRGHAAGNWERSLPQLWLGQHLPAGLDRCTTHRYPPLWHRHTPASHTLLNDLDNDGREHYISDVLWSLYWTAGLGDVPQGVQSEMMSEESSEYYGMLSFHLGCLAFACSCVL